MYDYLASPYTHPDSAIRHQRYEQARHVLYLLLSSRTSVYSPIVHCHHVALHHEMPHDAEFWQWYNFNMIEVCRSLLVLKIPGWERSKGVEAEMKYAEKIGTPIRGVTPVGEDRLVFDETTTRELAESLSNAHKAQ